jgi:hypothetical protein
MLWCSHGLGLFALEVHGLVCNGFRNGLQQALHVLQLWPSFIQPVSSQRRQTGSLRGGGAAVLITATCLLVSSSSRFPIAVVSSMIDPFIFFLLCGVFSLVGSFPFVCIGAISGEHDHFVGARQAPVDPCQDSPRQP